MGSIVVLAAALNGIAVLFAYFRIFTGRRNMTTVSLTARWPERLSVLLLTLLIVGGGLIPQSSVASRYHAAIELRKHRHVFETNDSTPASESAHAEHPDATQSPIEHPQAP